MSDTTHVLWIETFLRNLRIAGRMLRRNPGFSTVAVLSLALGIGANTAIFGLLNAVVLQPLPVHDPAGLVRLQLTRPQGVFDTFSYAEFEAVRDKGDWFRGPFAWSTRKAAVSINGEALPLDTVLVSGQYYGTLGITAALGRLPTPQDDQPGAPPVAVISYASWQNRFGGNPSILSQTLRIEGVPFTIVGVVAPAFYGTEVGKNPEVAIPLAQEVRLSARPLRNSLHAHWLMIMSRLAPGVSPDDARRRLETQWPHWRDDLVARATSPGGRQDLASLNVRIVDGQRGVSAFREQFSRPLSVLMAGVAVLLLLACANLANLLLMRATQRRQEIAVRLALGASRGQITGQLLTESLLLSILATALGVLFARWGTQLILAMLSTSQFAVQLDMTPDWRVFMFTAVIGLATTIVFGLIPASAAVRGNAAQAVRENARTGAARRRSDRVFVVAQVALTVVLLVAAGLFVRTLRELQTLDIGFDRAGVLLVGMDVSKRGEHGDRLLNTYRELLEQVRGTFGVRSASLSLVPPLTNGGGITLNVTGADGYVPRPGEDGTIYLQSVAPGYFATLESHVIDGRDISDHDLPDTGPVALIDESTARHYFPGRSAVGSNILLEGAPKLVIGVVKDAKYETLRDVQHHTIYVPLFQSNEPSPRVTLIVKVEPPEALPTVGPAVATLIRRGSPDVPLTLETLSQVVDRSLTSERLLTSTSSSFGLLALTIVAVGLYGSLAYSVARRASEIALRMALGASRADIITMICGEAFVLVGAGLALGLIVSFALGHYVSSLLFGLSATDPLAMAAAILLMIATAAVASIVPARRASRVDPISSLRSI